MWFLVIYATQAELNRPPSAGEVKSRSTRVLYGNEQFVRRRFGEFRLSPGVAALEIVHRAELVERFEYSPLEVLS